MSSLFSFEAVAKIIERYGGLLVEGLQYTLLLSVIAVFFGVIFGTLIAFMRRSRLLPFRWLAAIYTEIIRDTPLLLQLYVFYFLLPELFRGVPALYSVMSNKVICVAIALCFNSAAYVSEVIRSGIQAVDKGQTEAARSLGLNQRQTMLRVVLPQAVRNILPALCNEFVSVIKETSLASTFFVGDLMTQTQTISGITGRRFETMFIVGVLYFILNFVLSKLVAVLERRLQGGKKQ